MSTRLPLTWMRPWLTNWPAWSVLLSVALVIVQYVFCAFVTPEVPAQGPVDLAGFHEREHRRESLTQLTSAVRSLTDLRGCGDANDREDAATQAEIAAAVALLLTVASMEHEEMSRTP